MLNKQEVKWKIHRDVIVIIEASLTLDEFAKASKIVSTIRSTRDNLIGHPIIFLSPDDGWCGMLHNGDTFEGFRHLDCENLDDACAKAVIPIGCPAPPSSAATEQRKQTARRLIDAIAAGWSQEIFIDTHEDRFLRVQLLVADFLGGESNKRHCADCILSLLTSSVLDNFEEEIQRAEDEQPPEPDPDAQRDSEIEIGDTTEYLDIPAFLRRQAE